MLPSTTTPYDDSRPPGDSRPHGGAGSWFWHLVYLIYCLEVGVFLLFLPWLGIWENNYFLYKFPSVRPIVANPFLKGAVLGLGIVNLMIGIQEIVHFRKSSKSYFHG